MIADWGYSIVYYINKFLYRDDYYNKNTDMPNIAEVIIAKQKNGPIRTVNLVWRPEYTKFANMVRQ